MQFRCSCSEEVLQNIANGLFEAAVYEHDFMFPNIKRNLHYQQYSNDEGGRERK